MLPSNSFRKVCLGILISPRCSGLVFENFYGNHCVNLLTVFENKLGKNIYVRFLAIYVIKIIFKWEEHKKPAFRLPNNNVIYLN